MALANTPSWEFVAPPPLETVFPRAPRALTPLTPNEIAVLPKRVLRLAEFLFHSGRISWKDCCDAVRWQRDQRPSVGRIAVELGWLTHHEVARILRERVQDKAFGKPFCQYAREKGYLSARQVAAVLGRQRGLQRRIGDYFVDRGLLTRDQVEDGVRRLRQHNALYRRAP